MYRVWSFVADYTLMLILGALFALIWANVNPSSYHHFIEYPLVENAWIGHAHADEAGEIHRMLTVHYLISDVLMALFFAMAGKEVWEAVALKEGSLRGKKAMTPLVATAGGLFSQAEQYLTDLLNRIEHGVKHPVEIILFFFGLANAGVEFSAIGDATWLVLLGLIVGKPFGIWFMGWLAARPLGLGMPDGMKVSDLFVIGCIAAIGFTVSLFIAAVAFPPGETQDAAKMGALFSFFAAGMSLIAGKVFKVENQA